MRPKKEHIFTQSKPYLVAGPCGVESEEQVYESVKGLKALGVNAIRGGIWKPRSRPGSFEGLGATALPWLLEAAKSEGLPSITEVANVDHLEAAMKAGFEMVWLGARTTVNRILYEYPYQI